MRKTIDVLLMVLIIPGFAYSGFFTNFGIKGGMNSSNVTFSEDIAEEWNALWSFRVGVFYNLKIFKIISFQPEFFYTRKGAKATGTYFGEEITAIEKLDYFEVPLLLKMSFPVSGFNRFNVFAGGYGALNIGARSVIKYRGETAQEDIKSDINNFDYGIVFGGSINFWKLILDIRYSIGMQNIKAISFADYAVKNRSFTLLVGYSF